MRSNLIPLFFVLFFSFQKSKAQIKLSNTDIIKLDFKVLDSKKKQLVANDQSLQPAYHELIKNADNLLSYQPVTVMAKTAIPPSGNKHDYMSLAPYWWPDPSKKDGLPYIRKDGEVNPEVRDYPDKENMPKLCQNVYNLALAYYFSGKEIYAAHASKLVEVWFLDTATKMNPNLEYGQAVKGQNDGRGAGVIDTRQFIFLLDGVELLKTSPSWSSVKDAGLKGWFTKYLLWLNNSKIGIAEKKAKNNHGVWFDAQTLAIATYTGDKEEATKIIKRATGRLDVEMDKNGLFPLELERTTSLHYSVFILNAFNIIAQLAEKNGTDFYTLQTISGKSLKKGVDAIFPFITKKEKWIYPEIKPFSFSDSYALLLRAETKMDCTGCKDALKKENEKKDGLLLMKLL